MNEKIIERNKKLKHDLKIMDKALDYAIKECIYWQKQCIDHIPGFQGKQFAVPERNKYILDAAKYYSKEIQEILKGVKNEN